MGQDGIPLSLSIIIVAAIFGVLLTTGMIVMAVILAA